ncbi:MAG: ABC transporter permease [Bacteroidetes bacterium]|nr:ABC transporter permease [Bacteroidota bacterium]
MIKNYLKIAIRNLKRNITISTINILGLTLGLSIASLIGLYVQNELTYDSFHKDAKYIYRIYQVMEFGKSRAEGPEVNAPLGPYMVNHYPKVINQTRVSRNNNFKLIIGEGSFEEKYIYAEPSFFEIFSYHFIFGDSKTALVDPFSLVLSKKMAEKLYGNINPVGSVIKDENGKSYKITGVIENVPENSHLKFDIISSFATQYSLNEGKNNIDGWGLLDYKTYSTYIKLAKDFSPEELNEGFENISKTYLSDNPMFTFKFRLHELEKIYLYYGGEGNRPRVILFSIIGFFVLIIACINYMNLNTADALKRLKEIGMRKVLGANRKQLIRQFLTESILLSIIALFLALTLAEILLPMFNSVLQKNLQFAYAGNWKLTVSFILMAIVTGVLAGSYPAFYLSSIKPANALKGKFVFGSGHAFFRNALVVFQFAITTFLICCTGIIYMQIRHTNKADLGFNKDNIITLRLFPKNNNTNIVKRTDDLYNSALLIKNELLQFPEVSDVTVASGFPFGSLGYDRYNCDDFEKPMLAATYFVEANYVSLLEFKLIKGRDFSDEGTLENNSALINEAFVKEAGWVDPIGKTFTPGNEATKIFRVVGVVKDFHQRPFYDKILPTCIIYNINTDYINNIGIKVNAGNIPQIREKIEQLGDELNLPYNVNFSFIDQDVKDEYEEEYRTGKMFTNFAILAIIIASMGLYGLALFISRQKTKEIGVRKVFGGSVSEIILILSKNFIKLIIISAAISIPVAWYYMDKWLQSFVYQVENRWIVFVLATILSIVIATATIFYQSYKAAAANPVDSLKYE